MSRKARMCAIGSVGAALLGTVAAAPAMADPNPPSTPAYNSAKVWVGGQDPRICQVRHITLASHLYR